MGYSHGGALGKSFTKLCDFQKSLLVGVGYEILTVVRKEEKHSKLEMGVTRR